MLTVVTPASATRLTTVESVRSVLNLSSGTPNDNLLNTLIDQASRAITDYCKRSFGRETVRETLRRGEFGDEILLSRDPVTAVASVTVDGTALTTNDWERNEGLLYRLYTDSRTPWRGQKLVVQYTAGYLLPGQDGADLPSAIERAAILEIGAYLSLRDRDPLIKSESEDGLGSTSYWVPGPNSCLASPDAERLLGPYRRAAWSVG